MATFEGYERREAKILEVLKEYGISSIDECKTICEEKGIDPYTIVQETQPICFENAKWAYTVGCAIAIKKGCTKAADAAAAIGIGLQAFCIPGSVAENRKVGLGHGNLGKMLLSEETECFAFLAGHESFAAAEGAIKIALNANKVRNKPLRVILNGLGKDAAFIISRINGFTYVETEFDPYTEEVKVVSEKAYSNGPRADVKCYGADNVPEGVAIMKLEKVGVSITGNSTNPTRFQHPVAGTYKKWCVENGANYFSVASGGGTGRTLHPDNMAAGPASYGLTDYDFYTDELKIVESKAFSEGERAAVKCYGANDVLEGVAIMKQEGVDVSITGNSTNPTRFQHLVAGTYKKWALENGKKYFSVASGGGTGRTLHPDNMAAGPASYGLTDSMGRMHGDAQFAGSSSVPAHVEMMGLIGMGNNPMVGATVACAVAVYEACK